MDDDVTDPGAFDDDTIATPPPEYVGKYRIVGALGQGGMGRVYLARQEGLDRQVAVKVLSEAMAGHPEIHERFRREAHALAKLNHPGITAVFDNGVDDGRWYLVMEYVEGGSLASEMARYRGDLDGVVDVVVRVLEALHYAHELGIVHRDIKPANILMGSNGDLKVADFGLAKVAGDRGAELTQTSYTMGTPHYMAPEQVENPKDIDHRADLYSVGVLMYEMLTGAKPIGRFQAPSTLAGIDVDAGIDDVVMRLLEKDPADRFQTANEALRALESFRTRPELPTRIPTTRERGAVQGDRRRRFFLAVASLVGLIAAGLVIKSMLGSSGDPSGGASTAARIVTDIDWFERLQLAREDVPASWTFPPRNNPRSPLPRNPYIAKTEQERDQLLTVLDRQGLRAVSAAEIKRAYHVRVGFQELPTLTVLDLASPAAATRAKAMIPSDDLSPTWSHLEGNVLVFAARSQNVSVGTQRYLFEAIVDATRRKLGLDPIDLEGLRPAYLEDGMTLDALPNAGFGTEALRHPKSWLDHWGVGFAADEVDRVYVAKFSVGGPERGWMQLQYIVARVEDPGPRRVLMDAWRRAGGEPIEAAPLVGVALIEKINPRGDPWVLIDAVVAGRRELHVELARRLGVDPPSLGPFDPLLEVDAIELRDATFASDPEPTRHMANAVETARTWLAAHDAEGVSIGDGTILEAWTCSVKPGEVDALALRCASENIAEQVAAALPGTMTAEPERGVVLRAGPMLAVIVRQSTSVSYKNAFFNLVGRIGVKLAPHK